jgi:hypothetical protein
VDDIKLIHEVKDTEEDDNIAQAAKASVEDSKIIRAAKETNEDGKIIHATIETDEDGKDLPIFCPFISGLVHGQHLPMDTDGNARISSLKVIMPILGFSRWTAYAAGVANRLMNISGNLWFDRFNILDFRNGMIKHSCDSGILRHGFNQEKFDVLVAYGHDGKLTSANFNQAIEDRRKRENGTWIGARLSKLEFSILMTAFGTQREKGGAYIKSDDLLALYRDHKLPGHHLDPMPRVKLVVDGDLIHAEASLDGGLTGLSVELWHRRDFFLRSFLPSWIIFRLDKRLRINDLPGDRNHFHFELGVGAAPINIQLRVTDTRETISWCRRKVLTVIDGPSNIATNINLGKLRVPHWEYDKTYAFPMALASTFDDRLPQSFTLQAWLALIAVNIKNFIRQSGLTLSTAGSPSLKKTQEALGDGNKGTGTNQLENSDEYFVYRIVNGFNPAMLYNTTDDDINEICDWVVDQHAQSGDLNGGYYAEFDFKKSDSDVLHTMVSGKLFLKLEDKDLKPVQLIIKTDESSGDPKCYRVVPGDTSEWKAAKRAFLSAWATAGELDSHLGMGHLNVGQYAIAAYRHLHRNPLKDLLLPFLCGVTKINDLGKTSIFGTNGVLTTCTPLTTSAIWLRLSQDLGALDWYGWSPRKPLAGYEHHVYAKAANIFWGITTDCVDEFVEREKPGICDLWPEIEGFSADLTQHSVPCVRPANVDKWYDRSEYTELHDLGEKKGGDPRQIRMLGSAYGLQRLALSSNVNSVSDEVSPPVLHKIEDISDLKLACSYIIFHATFWHWWSNDLQITDVGNIFYAPLGLRNDAMKFDDSVLPPSAEAAQQLKFATMLSGARAGTIMEDRQGDIVECFNEALVLKQEAFQNLSNKYEPNTTFDVRRIRSRTNI